MTGIQAQFFDGRSSVRHPVELEIDAAGVVRLTGLGETREYPLNETRISERIGHTPRTLRFPDGSACQVLDNDAIDAALEALDSTSAQHDVHRLESQWTYAVLALIALIAIVWAAIQYGIPAAARHVAAVFPPRADALIGAQALELLDHGYFSPSKLPPERQQQLRDEFAAMTRDLDDTHEYRLEFRHGGELGANAFALPSGIVVMTDELVELAQADQELQTVLAHEIGHVVHRHSLRMLLQSSATSLLMIGLTGDVSSASVLVAGVPTALVQAKHSRQFEAEADAYAYAWMDRNGISHQYFRDMLARLEKKYGGGDAGAMSWLSSHPKTAERIRD
ncbi:MAG TPA: M48 family metallopeptidase [Steroidobacteraceae bacterium]|nr:M48 family metallopeptidase [Steroidobacteraceae bacterium]